MDRRSIVVAGALIYATLLIITDIRPFKHKIRPRRNLLPKTLQEWRKLCDVDDTDDNNTISRAYQFAWCSLSPILSEYGIRLWNIGWGVQLKGSKDFPMADNYHLVGPSAQLIMANIDRYCVWNGLSHAASRKDNRDFILRIMTSGGEGHEHLHLIQRLSSPPDIFQWNNHILPMVDHFIFEDITLGLFPRLHSNIQEVTFPSRQVSVEDVLHVVLQALEGIIYIHENRIAHRDLFFSNFLIEWCPESIKEGRSITRPRVYLIDFETAVEFSEETPESERLCIGSPFEKDVYARELPEEVKSETPYNPFLLDMWQFGFDLKRYFPMDIPTVTQLWDEINSESAQTRLSAVEASRRLRIFVESHVPLTLHVPYVNPMAGTEQEEVVSVTIIEDDV